MAKKSGKTSTPAEKRRKVPKGQAAAVGGPTAAVVEVGKVEETAAETAGAQTVPVDGAGSKAPAAEAVAETHETRGAGEGAEDATQPGPECAQAPAGADGDPAAATARPKEPGKARAPKPRSAEAAAKPHKLSALNAAAKVLAEEGRAMGCQEMINAMAAKGYWTSPGGKTPAATLYSALLHETRARGTQSRFTKTERGKFGLAVRG
jgi:HB1, ASXL, restriction endonuclease HTH domain